MKACNKARLPMVALARFSIFKNINFFRCYIQVVLVSTNKLYIQFCLLANYVLFQSFACNSLTCAPVSAFSPYLGRHVCSLAVVVRVNDCACGWLLIQPRHYFVTGSATTDGEAPPQVEAPGTGARGRETAQERQLDSRGQTTIFRNLIFLKIVVQVISHILENIWQEPVRALKV